MGISAFHFERQSSLWVDELSAVGERRAHRDLLEQCRIASSERIAQGSVGGEVDFTDVVVGQGFGEAADLVWVQMLVAVRRVLWNRNPPLCQGCVFAKLKGSSPPL